MKTEKHYSSLNEFANEFKIKQNFNKDVPENIYELWNSIIEFANASMELGGQGNSGEFHDDKEEKSLSEILNNKEQTLINNFSKFTGYTPFFVQNKIYPVYIKCGKQIIGNDYSGAWDFEKV